MRLHQTMMRKDVSNSVQELLVKVHNKIQSASLTTTLLGLKRATIPQIIIICIMITTTTTTTRTTTTTTTRTTTTTTTRTTTTTTTTTTTAISVKIITTSNILVCSLIFTFQTRMNCKNLFDWPSS